MASIKEKWDMHRLEKVNAKNKKILEKMGATKKQIKSHNAIISELGKKFSGKNDNIDSKNETSNKKLKKIHDGLKSVSRSVGKKLKGVSSKFNLDRGNNNVSLDKRSNKVVKKDVKTNLDKLSSIGGKLSASETALAKDIANAKKRISLGITNDNFSEKAKTILKKYAGFYEKLTINSLKEFIEFSEGYELKVINRFNPNDYKLAFKRIKSAGKEVIIGVRKLKSIFDDVYKLTHQRESAGASGLFMDPFTAFAQSLMRLPTAVKQLIKLMRELSSQIGDKENSEKIILQVQFTLAELQDIIYENPAKLVDETKLLDPSYFSECINRLTDFSYGLWELAGRVNRRNTNEKIQQEFLALYGECKR